RLETGTRQSFLAFVGTLYSDLQIVPGCLPGDRIRVREAVATGTLRQQFRNQVIEQEALGCFGGVVIKAPGASALANGVPRPDRVRINAVHQPDLCLDPAHGTVDPDPVI